VPIVETRTPTYAILYLLGAGLGWAGCASGAGSVVPVGPDARPDASPNAARDGGVADASEAGAGPYGSTDASDDRDAGGPDAGGSDAGASDGGRSCDVTIEGLRAGATGRLCRALVTYRYSRGFFLQARPDGPAIQVFEGFDWTPDVNVGDRIAMEVTSVGSFRGTAQVEDHGPIAVQGRDESVEPYHWPLPAALAERWESHLVELTGAEVAAIDGADVQLRAPSDVTVALRVSSEAEGVDLCEGAIVDLVAPVTEFDEAYRLHVFRAEDFDRIDEEACPPAPRAPEPGEVLINELLADPPPASAGDANCDGTRDANDDEFIELVSLTGDRIALGNVEIRDATGLRHAFADDAVLEPGAVSVVFGGGGLACDWPAGVTVITASGGLLGLNNAGDTVQLVRVDGTSSTMLLSMQYGEEADTDQSLTLAPDLDDEAQAPEMVDGFEGHGAASPDGSLFSPGRRLDGSAF
jgi:hypothetical protein